MIEGSVTDDLEPTVELTVHGPNGERERLEFVVDTGFTGTLALHSAVVAALGLQASGAGCAVLGRQGDHVRKLVTVR